MKNILNKPLKICSKKPLTGYTRRGYCDSKVDDFGKHYVCAKMDKQFLDYTASVGNDLRHVVKPGDRWCLCQGRYFQAHKSSRAPLVITSATSNKVDPIIKDIILKPRGKGKKQQKGGIKLLPKLRKLTKKNKKHIYRLKDPQYKRILAINEGINTKQNNTFKKKKLAATRKKARFNILRLYRKNKDVKGCRRLTKDMRYMDKTYKLGKTNKIC